MAMDKGSVCQPPADFEHRLFEATVNRMSSADILLPASSRREIVHIGAKGKRQP